MRKTELKIKLSNLNHNIDVIKKYTSADIQAVVKANSYGLSASEVAKTIENKVESFSVVTLDEALDLRKVPNFNTIASLDSIVLFKVNHN